MHCRNLRNDEYTGKPILDENGKMQLREEYYLDGVECDLFSFDMECKELNVRFRKSQKYDEIKSTIASSALIRRP